MIDLSTTDPTDRELNALRALEGKSPQHVFVFGTNRYARAVCAAFKCGGFVDDYSSDQSLDGLPILRLHDVPRSAAIISCVVEARPLTALQRLNDAGFTDVISYYLLQARFSELLPSITYLDGARDDVVAHIEKYERLSHRLGDDASREVLRDLLALRVGGRLLPHGRYSVAVERQYFEDFVRLRPGERFVDGGGFDGDTTERFVRAQPAYESVDLFEPFAPTLERARERLAAFPRIRYHALGLHDETRTMRFMADGSASRLSNEGDVAIEVTALDQVIDGPVTYVKLDVEGAECAALRGAARTIERYRPKLAVCVYHAQSDFWRVPECVLGIDANYDVHLRHYTEGVLESVMYFLPRA